MESEREAFNKYTSALHYLRTATVLKYLTRLPIPSLKHPYLPPSNPRIGNTLSTCVQLSLPSSHSYPLQRRPIGCCFTLSCSAINAVIICST